MRRRFGIRRPFGYDARDMSASTVLFLFARIAHVLFAAIWIGAVVFTTFFVMPSLGEIGPAGAPFMQAMIRRKLHVFMASLGGLTVVTGLYLYYRFTGGFDPALSGTRGAMVFGTGGILGIIALVIGGAVIGRNMKKIGELTDRLATAPPADRAVLGGEIAAAQARAGTGSRIVVALLVIAISLMAIGHYV